MSEKLLVLETEELNAMPESRAKAIRKVFQPMADRLEAFENDFNDVVKQYEDGEINDGYMAVVKRLRLDVGKIRIDAGKVKADQKKAILVAGRAIDGIYNILKWAVEGKEEKLKEIETHQERMEEERIRGLQASRVASISMYLEDASERDLGSMDADVWEAYLGAKLTAYNDRIAAEKKAEEDRIIAEKKAKEEAAELEKKRKTELAEAKKKQAETDAENKRLKAIADKAAKEKAAADLAKVEAEENAAKIAADAAKKAKAIADEAIRKEKLHKAELKKSADAEIAAKKKEEKAKEELAKAQIESNLFKANEIKRKLKEEAEKEKEDGKSDKTKLKDLADGFESFDAVSSMTTKDGKRIGKRVGILLKKVADDIYVQVENMK